MRKSSKSSIQHQLLRNTLLKCVSLRTWSETPRYTKLLLVIKWASVNFNDVRGNPTLELKAYISFHEPGVHRPNNCPYYLFVPRVELLYPTWAGPGNSVPIFIRNSIRINITAQASRCTLQSHFTTKHGLSKGTSYGRHIFWINPKKNAAERLQRFSYRLPPERYNACWDNSVPITWVMFLRPRSCEK